MKQVCLLPLLVVFSFVALFAAEKTAAGDIEPGLQSRIQTLPAMQFVPVWIKLPRPKGQERLALSLESSLPTQEERYTAAMNRLTAEQSASQAPLLGYLRGLESSGRVRNVKPHWISNVIEAEIASDDISGIAAHPSVELVAERPLLLSIEPGKDQSVSLAAAIGENLKLINADNAWQAGFTGAGRLVCSFDTGVNGTHVALQPKWKGNDGDSAAAWFDPVYHQKAPYVVGTAHGTHVMGIMVGSNAADTVGVAIGAKWISAGVVDVPGASLLDAFEWAANPDGDPNTFSDVPDVINHSWGSKGVGCTDMWYDAIENCEALGIVNIFACGNEGPAVSSIRNPAVRANDSLDCFAVGNIKSTAPITIANGSSRGPSLCPFNAIKPNVVAPGEVIRSSYGSGYSTLSGTSMSAPHVSGLVALLRQKNPNATVTQIKTAILNTAADFALTGLPNNTFGWGVIDCMAALNALGNNSGSNLKMFAFDHTAITPGASVGGTITLQNAGTTNLSNCALTITGTNPSITVLDGTCSFGSITAGATKLATDSISVVINDTVTEGAILSIQATLSGTGYSRQQPLYFAVEPALTRSFVSTTANRIDMSLSNFGTYGCDDNSFYPLGQTGFKVDGAASDWYECGLMIGTDAAHISDGVRNLAAEFDGDFAVSPGGNIALSVPGGIANEETYARFNDSRAENPIGLDITQQSYEFTSSNRNDFIILRYIVRNTSGIAIPSAFVGLYLDWDINVYSYNRGAWETGDQMIWACYNDGLSVNRYRGVAILDGEAVSALISSTSLVSFPAGFTEEEKYNALTGGFSTADNYRFTSADICQVLSAGPLSLTAGALDTIAFAILVGDSLTHIQSALADARTVYGSMISCCRNTRGNVNNDPGDATNITDLTAIVNYLFKEAAIPACVVEADVNGNGAINIVDLTYLVNYLFKGGPLPPACP